jgi:hypothetical protein
MKNILYKLFSTIIVSTISTSSYAYNLINCSGTPMNFGGGNMTFNLANNITAANKTAIRTGFDRLTVYSNSSITTNDNGDNGFSSGNSQNEIFMDSSVPGAHCWYSYSVNNCTVVEADIVFGNLTWHAPEDSGHLPYADSGRSIIGAAVHEGGHCIGIAHENTTYNMMGADYSHVTRNGLVSYYGPGADLSNALINRWGAGTQRDVGATVMRYDGVSGEYSTHKFGILKDSSGTELEIVGSFDRQPAYRATAGETITMQVTLENNGATGTETPRLGIYLSSNNVISPSDIQLTSLGTSLSRNNVVETEIEVSLPIDTSGTYFLGAYIDDDQLIAETTNANNVAYYPLEIINISENISEDNYEPNDTLGAAYDLSNNESTLLSSIDGLGMQNNDDWYKIFVDANADRVQASLSFSDVDGDINLRLYDASGNLLSSSTSTTDDENIVFSVASNAYYYLQVYFGNAGNSYDLYWSDNGVITDTPETFIERLYQNILGRVSDPGGLEFWLGEIESESASSVAFGFFNSPEFAVLELFDTDFIDILYLTIFNREADVEGRAYWVSKLENGQLRDTVLYGFFKSPEMVALANLYSVTAFSDSDQQLYLLKQFVIRFYEMVLSRNAEVDGYYNWVDQLVSDALGAGDIARAFFFSPEFTMKGYGDSEFLSIAYLTILNRAPDVAGLESWLNSLETGSLTRAEVLDGFIGSPEFSALAGEYGIRL